MASSPAPVMPAQVSAASYGRLQLAVTGRNDYTPIENAVIQVTDTGNPDNIIEELTTDNSGETPTIELPAPPVSYSLESSSAQPYSEYNFTVQAEGYSNLTISGAQILANVTALQSARLMPLANIEASSEIYATWPESSIIANCLAIISFTLNRVFTEWYRNKGYDFTITNSTAYDHFFVYGRNIFENISETVDMIFSNYLSRPGVLQPILTQYCDGRRVSCPNWMALRIWANRVIHPLRFYAITMGMISILTLQNRSAAFQAPGRVTISPSAVPARRSSRCRSN